MLQFLFLSLDSFLAASALGMLGLSASRRRALCLAFGICDGTATFAGLQFHLTLPFARQVHDYLPMAVILCLWALFVGFLVRRIATKRRLNSAELALLPIILCVDNLFASPLASEIAVHGAAAPLIAGMLSASLAFAGYELGSLAAHRVHRRLALGLGSGLLLLIPILS